MMLLEEFCRERETDKRERHREIFAETQRDFRRERDVQTNRKKRQTDRDTDRGRDREA